MKEMLDNEAVKKFVLAGHALFTLVSKVSGVRYTYKVSKAKGKEMFFVGYLTGPNNEADYKYLGVLRPYSHPFERLEFVTTKASPPKSKVMEGFNWFLRRLVRGAIWQEQMEFYHAGHCGRCGRTLTVPESIEMGIGPECMSKMGG